EETLALYWEPLHGRFDLFDEERPFYQVPPIEGVERRSVAILAAERASGNNATLFDHSVDDDPAALTCAEAARFLVATQAYAIGFGKSSPFYLCAAPLT